MTISAVFPRHDSRHAQVRKKNEMNKREIRIIVRREKFLFTLETNFGSISANPLERLDGAASRSLALVTAAMTHVLL